MDTQKPVKVFREGAVAVSVWLRQTSAGVFYDATFSRCWKDEETGKFGYSQSFSDYHLEPLADVARQAAAWIVETKANAQTVCAGDGQEQLVSDLAEAAGDDGHN